MWINVITLLFAIKYSSAIQDELYEIPVPQIVAFTTGGFRISIPDKNGITEFRFHANVNQEIEPLRPGRINIETHQKTNRIWSLENTQVLLKKGDIIFYWIFVKKERLGYVRQPQHYQVKELVPYFGNTPSHVPLPPSQNFPISPTATPEDEPLDNPTIKDDDINTNSLTCFNNTSSTASLQNQVDELTQKVDILMNVIEKLPDAKKLTINDTYKIPEPEIQAFTPKGFRVSIEDAPGIRLFAFHGNVNRELVDLEAGVFSRDILQKRNGKWTFEDRKTRLRVGDVVHYWLFVIKDELGYRLDDGRFEIKELISSPFESSRPQSNKNKPNKGQAEAAANCPTPEPPSATALPEQDRDAFLRICELTVLNATQALLTFQSQLDELRETNQQLSAIIEKYPDGKKLTISGRIPDDEALLTAKFIIREKLELNPTIVSAVRNSDNSVTIEVATIREKLQILEVAKKKLLNTKIDIS